MANIESQNEEYDIDDSVEDYSEDYDYDYEGEEMEQVDASAHKNKKLKADQNQPENLLDSSLDASGQNSSIDESVDNRTDVGAYEQKIIRLEKKFTSVKSKYKEAKDEINLLKRKRETEPAGNTDQRVKQLEDRVLLIKTKAKEKIAEKDQVIAEQNEKLKSFGEMLAMLEVNCKQAVVKYNEAQIELAKKEETLQQHLSFKNRYDYKVNFLDEKCRRTKNEYEVKIKKLEDKLGVKNIQPQTQSPPPKQEVKEERKLKISKVTEIEVAKEVQKKVPKTLRIQKVEPEIKPTKAEQSVTVKEVEAVHEESRSSMEKNEESNLESKPAKEEPKEIVTNLPGLKITLTEAIDELDQIADLEEPKAVS
eukprot:GFUD01025922.1.p1 GENE.GFUD01025922.1~~GFUD01025922.1.p1  ORF type:complete len:365 (+),score=124.16 GFUD01025922.1:279-1373(+)